MSANLHGLLPVTREEADRAGRERARHDVSTNLLKTAARVAARRSLEKHAYEYGEQLSADLKLPHGVIPKGSHQITHEGKTIGYASGRLKLPAEALQRVYEKRAAEGDMGAILGGSIANKFGTRAAFKELAETEDNQREPAVTDTQEMSLPQIPAGRGIVTNTQPGQLLQAGTTIDEFRRQEGLSKHALSLAPVGRLAGRVGEAVVGAGRRAGRLFARGERKAVGQLATAEQAAHFRPVGTPPPIPSAALPARGGAMAAPGHLAPPAGTPAAPGGAGGPYRTPGVPAPDRPPAGKLSRKASKATEVEGVQQSKPRKGPGLLGGAMVGALGLGTAAALTKGVPAAARAAENATANPMAYGMGYSNLPYGYTAQESTNF